MAKTGMKRNQVVAGSNKHRTYLYKVDNFLGDQHQIELN